MRGGVPWAQAVQRQPRTLTEILQDARKAMELEDAYVAWLEGRPVPQLRHPRRTLRQWLTGRQPEPALVPPPVSEIVPVWRAVDPGGTWMLAEYRICR